MDSRSGNSSECCSAKCHSTDRHGALFHPLLKLYLGENILFSLLGCYDIQKNSIEQNDRQQDIYLDEKSRTCINHVTNLLCDIIPNVAARKKNF